MRTLHIGLRVADLGRSIAFYTSLGYEVVGNVPETAFGSLTMLKLPGDEFVTVELVHQPGDGAVGPGGSTTSFIPVESMTQVVADLAARGVHAESPSPPDGSGDFRTWWVTDPDGPRGWPGRGPRPAQRLAGAARTEQRHPARPQLSADRWIG